MVLLESCRPMVRYVPIEGTLIYTMLIRIDGVLMDHKKFRLVDVIVYYLKKL